VSEVYEAPVRYPRYNEYPLEVLHNLADNFLKCLTAANLPMKRARVDAWCVQAAPGRLRLNFESAVIRNWVASDLMAVEGIVEEAWHRMETQNRVSLSLVNTLNGLGYESRQYLDNLTCNAALGVDDLMNVSADTARSLFKAAP
jgi:hypothetical protein